MLVQIFKDYGGEWCAVYVNDCLRYEAHNVGVPELFDVIGHQIDGPLAFEWHSATVPENVYDVMPHTFTELSSSEWFRLLVEAQ